MSMPDRPQIDCERHHTTLYVEDILAAVDFYTSKLGFSLGFTWEDPPTFAGVNLGDVQIFLTGDAKSAGLLSAVRGERCGRAFRVPARQRRRG